MRVVRLEDADDLAARLRQLNQPMDQATRELMVMELYRRGEIWRGKAAALLDLSLLDFIRRASGLGIPYVEFSEEEWKAELGASKTLCIRNRVSATRARRSRSSLPHAWDTWHCARLPNER